MMPTKYTHTNIVAKDYKELADFYSKVFGCKKLREVSYSGEYLEKGTGVKGAVLKGVNLVLPGHKSDAPRLEIFQYNESLEKSHPVVANRLGYGHIAFQVDNINETIKLALTNGAKKLGEVASNIYSSGTSSYIYLKDPEGNVVELQHWVPK